MPPQENDNHEQPKPSPTNAELKVELTHHTDQLNKLWSENTKQSAQLARLDDVPAKLDRLLDVNIQIATIQQQQLTQGQAISTLNTRLDNHDVRLTEGSKKFSYYAGAMAVAGLIFGIVVWMGEQAVTGAFAELSSIHATIGDLQQSVKMLQFQEGAQPRSKQ
jgi:hypothetical protein